MKSLSTLLLGCCLAFLAAPARADTGLESPVKLTVLAFGDDEFFILKANEAADKAELVAGQKFLGDVSVKAMSLKDGRLAITFGLPAGEAEFKGQRASEGPRAGQFLGTFKLQGGTYPARLEKTESKEVAELKQGPILLAMVQARREADPKARVEKLRELLDKHKADPGLHPVYPVLLQAADGAGLKADEVKAIVTRWFDEAKPYGDIWLGEVRVKTLGALNGKKPYAELALELAQDARKNLAADASTEQKAGVMKALSTAASLAGNDDLAKEAKAKLTELEGILDNEYLAKVPPFKPEPLVRKAAGDDRVVLFELFTGTQCPPCVAADVAFDGLVKASKPTEVILLQYHLHIPGPDPLTNPDSVARSQYYVLRGTPSTYFNGMSAAGGGGGMGNSKAKYDQFVEAIQERLEGNKRAKITLSVKREGDKLSINAQAETAKAADDKKDDKKEDAAKEKPVLRLVLTEETVRYVGSNGIRFHHQVVRGFPGGTDGKPLVDGKCEVSTMLALGEVKKGLDEYIEQFAKTRPFANDPPPVELKGLAIVAFVQDDQDKSVWHAHRVEVPE